MILDLPGTTTSKISKALVQLREQGGAVALGRVLTIIIDASEEDAESAISAANAASREHPCRIIALINSEKSGTPRLDAELRVGGDAGASEVIVLRPFGAVASNKESLISGLLLPDAPVVAWWPKDAPLPVSKSAVGKIATRRITDALAQSNSTDFLTQLSENYAPGDSDFSWTRLTLWRAQLAAILDQPPFEPILSAKLIGDTTNPSVQLISAWLKMQLDCLFELEHREDTEGVRAIYKVTFQRADSEIEIVRDRLNIAELRQTNQPTKEISLPVRTLSECLAEDLRRLDEDTAFERVLRVGLPEIRKFLN